VAPPLVVDTDGPIGVFRRWTKQFYATELESAESAAKVVSA
jgi:hypothetical protein